VTDALQSAAADVFPDRTIDAIDAQVTRPGNEVGRVTFAEADPCYLKLATDTTRRLARELAAMRYAVAHCPIEVPTVVAADIDADRPYLAMTPLPGTPLNDPWTGDGDRESLVYQAGRTLAAVHEANFDRVGTITGGDADRLELAGETWTETLCRTVEWRAEDWFPERFADLPERLAETIRDVDPSFEGEPTLLHADCSRINVHLDPNGLLDWERALVGDPAFDLVDATGHLITLQPAVEEPESDLIDAIEAGYCDRAGSLPAGIEERRPLYRVINHLLVPQAFNDWSSKADKSADELAASVREEFDERLSEARGMIA
jgi:aminoglycoside phosphotransferase (APT) family kinase protein